MTDVQKYTRRFLGKEAGALLLTLAAVLALWLFIAASYHREAIRDISRSLETINSYKASEIASWLDDQNREAVRLSRHPFLGEIVSGEISYPGTKRAELAAWLKDHTEQNLYTAMAFLSTNGTVIAATPGYITDTETPFKEAFKQAAKKRTPVLTDLYRTSDGRLRMAMFSPVSAGGRGGKPVCVLVIKIDPELRFYPMLKAAPLFFTAAETLLVRKEGESILYLNELDYLPGSALKLSHPISEEHLPAAAAIRGVTGFFAGVDYRGVRVFSVIAPVPGSKWTIITKVDRDTIIAPVKRAEYLRLTLILLAAGLLYTLVYIILRDRERVGRALIREGERRLAALFSNLPGVAYRSINPLNWTIEFLSEGSLGLTGYRPEELLTGSTPSFFELIIPGDRERVRKILQALPAGNSRYELTYSLRCKDGTIKTVWEQGLGVKGASGAFETLEGFISDITPLKRAEAALHVSEQIFSAFMEHSPIYIFFKDENIRPIHLSRNYETMIGKPLDQLLGRSMDELFPSDLAKSMVADDKKILAEGKEIVVEEELNGRSYRTFKFPITIEGKPPYLAGYTLDITKQKKAEKERLTHLHFFESMDRVNRAIQGANNLETMMSDVLNAVLTILDCDRAWLFYPCDPEAPSFRVPMEITKPEYPGAKTLNTDIPLPPDMARDLREALGSAEPVTYTVGADKGINKVSAEQFGVKSQMMVALYPKIGKPWVFGIHQCSYPRVWTPEEMRLVQEIGRRLADGLTGLLTYNNLLESDNSLKKAQQLARIGNWMLDLPSGKLTWSDEIYRIFEIDPDKFGASYDAFLDAIHPNDREDVNRNYTDSVKNRSKYDITHRLLMKDGRVKYVNESCETSYALDGRPLVSIGTVQDITERKLAELELKRLNRELIDKKNEMENFLYITTHDLRSPLVNIQGFSQNLERYIGELRDSLAPADLPQEYRERLDNLAGERIPRALKFVRESSFKMDALITALLKVSRVGRVEMKPETIDMNKTLKKIIDSMRYQLEQADGEVRIQSLPPCTADPGAVVHIFTNLLDNAIKYRAERPLLVEITGELNGAMARYTVADNGAGIPEKHLPRIWDIFYRGERPQKTKGEGIGLAMSKRLIERNGGRIRTESKEGEGSVFYVELPAGEAKNGL